MSQPMNVSLKDTLSGEHAFFNREDYQETTRKDLSSKKTTNLVYRHTVENKVWPGQFYSQNLIK